MAETRRRFDSEFRAGAVRIVLETGKPLVQVARDLGINAGTLSDWVNQTKAANDRSNGALSESEREKLIRLRRECADLSMERDALKRSVVLWSRRRQSERRGVHRFPENPTATNGQHEVVGPRSSPATPNPPPVDNSSTGHDIIAKQ